MNTDSVFDAHASLSSLLDLEGFRELCRSFGALYGIGIKVVGEEGEKVADVRVSSGDHCGYLFNHHNTRVMCTNLVEHIKATTLDSKDPKPHTIDCFSGLRYKIKPIVHDGSPIGRIILGPYRPPDLLSSPMELLEHEPKLDLVQLGGFLEKVPSASDPVSDEVLEHLCRMLDVIIHSSYRVFLTSKMHIQSSQEVFEELRVKNKELRSVNRQLKDLDRMKSNFLATVSHELRTPLTSVIGYSEMLLEGLAGDLNEAQRNYLDTILEKGESLLTLIGQLLDLAKLDSGSTVMHRSDEEPGSIIGLCVSDVAPQAQKKQITINVDIADDVGSIEVDRDKIRRVITNLLGNAIKFTPEGGTVSVLVDIIVLTAEASAFSPFDARQNRCLRIRVTDTGIGIPQEALQKIFESFYQVDNSETREFGGTGLGLSIVQNFVRSHGGRVEVESELGHGSTFSVYLPYAQSEPQREGTSPEFFAS